MSLTYQRGDEPIPGFRLVQPLGAGGCGEVWKATAPGGIDVALKFIKLAVKMGLKEFRSLRLVKRIHHPNLIPIHAFWLVDSFGAILDASPDIEKSLLGDFSPRQKFENQETLVLGSRSSPKPAALIIAMGLGDRSLTERLEECQDAGHEGIPLEELMDYMDGAAQGIDFLNSPRHDLGSGPVAIQHCDIKPRNLLVVGGAVQVCDFGLARLTDSQVTTAALSAAYAPPESWRGESPRPTTDQYSLAVSYYELRTGALPFEETSQVAVMNAHLEGRLQLSKLPEGERLVIARATSLSPDDRYESCRAMIAALRQAQRVAAAAQPKQPAVAEIDRRPDGRVRRLLAGLTVLCMVLGGLVGLRELLPTNAALPPTNSAGQQSPQPWVPEQFAAAPGAQRVAADRRFFYDRIQRSINGITVDFILVPENNQHPLPPELPTFYIMENKVSAKLFRAFAVERPDTIKQPQWQVEPTNQSDSDLPVMGVFIEDAQAFAAWLGGVYAHLPSVEQWDKAAGLNYHEAHGECGHVGPYSNDWTRDGPSQIAVNCESPRPVGTTMHDVSHPFGCRDMAGNGREWTCSIQVPGGSRPVTIPPSVPEPFTLVMLRGRTFYRSQPEVMPLTYHDLRTVDAQESEVYQYGLPDVGFRVVIECARGAQTGESLPTRPAP